MVCSNLSSLAVRFTHSSSPNGRPLSMLTRTRPNSFALSGAFTRSVQSTGRSTGQGDKMALIASSPCILAHRPLQRQCSARATNPAPHSVPVDVPQDGQQMFVARHREALEPEPSLIQMTGGNPVSVHHSCPKRCGGNPGGNPVSGNPVSVYHSCPKR